MDFITIDFEIANNKMSSACSLGMVFVQDNKIVNEEYYLIQPPGMVLDEAMSNVHKLNEEDLKNAPLFDEVWEMIKHYFHKDNLIIAHNAQFDFNVLKNCLIEYSLEVPEFEYVCSIPISTRACRGEGISNSLEARANRFGIVIDNHHNALSDARACAELVLKCIELKKRKSIQSYCSTYSSIPIRRFSELKLQSEFKKRTKFNRVSMKDLTPTPEDIDKNHPFFNQNLVFTGNLKTMDKKEAMQKAVNVGAVIKSGVSKKTNYLIVGEQDKSLVGEKGISTKEVKAYDLIKNGIDIKVINESEFVQIINSTITV